MMPPWLHAASDSRLFINVTSINKHLDFEGIHFDLRTKASGAATTRRRPLGTPRGIERKRSSGKGVGKAHGGRSITMRAGRAGAGRAARRALMRPWGRGRSRRDGGRAAAAASARPSPSASGCRRAGAAPGRRRRGPPRPCSRCSASGVRKAMRLRGSSDTAGRSLAAARRRRALLLRPTRPGRQAPAAGPRRRRGRRLARRARRRLRLLRVGRLLLLGIPDALGDLERRSQHLRGARLRVSLWWSSVV